MYKELHISMYTSHELLIIIWVILAFKKGPIIGVFSGCQHDKYEKNNEFSNQHWIRIYAPMRYIKVYASILHSEFENILAKCTIPKWIK